MNYNKDGSRRIHDQRRAMGNSPFRYQHIHGIPGSGSRSFEQNDLYEPLPLSYQQRNRFAEGNVHPHYYPADPVSHHHPSAMAVGRQIYSSQVAKPIEDPIGHEDLTSKLKDYTGHNDETASQGSTDSKMRQKRFGSKKRPLTAYQLFYRDERSRILASSDSKPNSSRQSEDEALTPRKRRRTEPEHFGSLDELDRLVEEHWDNLDSHQKEAYAHQAQIESNSYSDEGKESDGKEHDAAESLDRKVPSNIESTRTRIASAGATQQEASHSDERPPQSQYTHAAPPFTSRYVRGPADHAHSAHLHSRPSPSHQYRIHEHGFNPYVSHPQGHSDLSQHQSAMQFENSQARETIHRDRLEIPPSRTVIVHDANGVPRRYELMYAAVSMPYNMANQYMKSLSSATQNLLDASNISHPPAISQRYPHAQFSNPVPQGHRDFPPQNRPRQDDNRERMYNPYHRSGY